VAGHLAKPGRLAKSSVAAADLAAWLLSDGASFVTGATVPVDGGPTVPGGRPPRRRRAFYRGPLASSASTGRLGDSRRSDR
jgi:hypothetical protein